MNILKKLVICSISMCLIFLIGLIKTNLKKENTCNEFTSEKIQNVALENETIIRLAKVSENEEQALEFQETEDEGFEEQGIVSYNGSEKNPNIQLGNYEGLTYYSQIDERWKNKNYSSIGDINQTIGSSGCGPTSASIVVSSIKGKITPDVMADLYLKHGYRSPNQGTYWSAFKWTADVFNIEYKEAYKLDDAISMLNQNYYIIASCNQGLFTYGGHFVVLVGTENGKIKVYDPYLYSTKFDTSTRRGKAEIKGNTIYVSMDNFRNFANYKKFFAFKNDRKDVKENTNKIEEKTSNTNVKNVNYNVTITANGGLRIRSGASTSYSILGLYKKGTQKTIYAESNGWGKTEDGWIYLGYTSKNITNTENSSITKNNRYTTGTYKVNCSKLNVRTGPGTNYKIKSLSQLTYSARKQGGYVRNVKFTVNKVINNWGSTPSGWVCLDYAIKIK